MMPVRSNCTPFDVETSKVRTTFAHGPGQAAGGVYENGLFVKSLKAKCLKSVTVHGFVSGRETGISAVTVFDEPDVPSGIARIDTFPPATWAGAAGSPAGGRPAPPRQPAVIAVKTQIERRRFIMERPRSLTRRALLGYGTIS